MGDKGLGTKIFGEDRYRFHVWVGGYDSCPVLFVLFFG